MKGKILILSSSWNSSITYELISGVCERVAREGIELHIMNIYDVLDPPGFYEKELEIISLPDPEQYDGVLIAMNSITSTEMVEKVIEPYEKSSTKILCLDRSIKDHARIGTDNYGAIYEITSHLIEQHGCNTFNFIGGPEKNEESKKRFEGFRDALRDHHIPLEPERVRYYHFMHKDGVRAYQDFKELGLQLPDAVICANDDMALGYCSAADKDNFHAPDDFKITGFDNIYNARFFYPSITTVDRDWKKQGYDSADILIKMIHGLSEDRADYVSGTIVKFNESCGCVSERDYRADFRDVFKQRHDDVTVRDIQRRIRRLLTAYSTEEELPLVLGMCRNHMKLDDICICLNENFHEPSGPQGWSGYTEHMTAYTCAGRYEIDRKNELFPSELYKTGYTNIFMFSPLHFGNRSYGYCVIPYSEGGWRLLDFRSYTETISTAMDALHQRCELNAVNDKLKDLYLKDSMTGLYNRSGYASLGEEFFASRDGKVFLIYCDMDNLKEMNDAYGHRMGDQAIECIAEAIGDVFGNGSVNARMGGDEFLVIGAFTEETEVSESAKRLDAQMKARAREKNMPLMPEVSMGLAWNTGEDPDITLETLVNRADTEMYRVKEQRRQNRES